VRDALQDKDTNLQKKKKKKKKRTKKKKKTHTQSQAGKRNVPPQKKNITKQSTHINPIIPQRLLRSRTPACPPSRVDATWTLCAWQPGKPPGRRPLPNLGLSGSSWLIPSLKG